MANYYTQFCLHIAKASVHEIEFWRRYSGSDLLDEDDEPITDGLDISVETEDVYLSDNCDSGNLSHATLALRSFLARFPSRAPMTLTFANTCDKHRPDAFDGGVVVVWPRKESWSSACQAGAAIAAGLPVPVDVIEFSDPLEELRESTSADPQHPPLAPES